MNQQNDNSRWQRASVAAQRAMPGSVGRFFTKRMIIMLSIVLGLLVLVFGYIIGMQMIVAGFMANMKQVTTVATTHAQPTVWQSQLKAVGTLHAIEGADLSSELAGIVTKVNFEPGQDIKKGMVLVQLRDDSDRATLAANRASADQALRTYKRYVELIKTQAISQTNYDQALASMLSTKAAVEAQAATVDKKAIRAPFDGRVGIRQVDVGQYVGAGTTVVTLQRLDPIYVDFSIAQQQIPSVKAGDRVVLTSDTFPGRTFSGKITALDPKVDTATRTVRVRAEVANPEKLLLPGMFASVMIDTGAPQKPLTLPQTAITYNTYGNIVFVVQHGKDKDGKDQLIAQQRFVTTGEARGNQVIVLGGITSRDEVVSAGANKLKNGTVITINNQITLPNDANSHPTEQ
ncbi:efflux RND transporter periplasmic adaptor subunit [Rhizomicrobium electricum]|uniref:Efflux RND transporter periplasmic adaptor subunit n=1 Tax=Rhizomicrobium electricum TaxID=480070 RepID=A0ABN1ETV6_9PROT|nr:efflux RND transporter periplasmic adaptor subunit [Rhizomicrobium electricum]NIJ49667.1 membrane fusion protein (multidrug efflux system) [Rhizomicrobium electricum]